MDIKDLKLRTLVIDELGTIVLVTDYGESASKFEGVVIYSDNSEWIGCYGTYWNYDFWRPYHGKVILDSDLLVEYEGIYKIK